ncbi:MAG: hypothetical protein ACR2HN_05430 [Tepidiformaceae bacterium]
MISIFSGSMPSAVTTSRMCGDSTSTTSASASSRPILSVANSSSAPISRCTPAEVAAAISIDSARFTCQAARADVSTVAIPARRAASSDRSEARGIPRKSDALEPGSIRATAPSNARLRQSSSPLEIDGARSHRAGRYAAAATIAGITALEEARGSKDHLLSQSPTLAATGTAVLRPLASLAVFMGV